MTDPVSNSYDGNTPTVNADADAWGDEINTAFGQIMTTLNAFVTAINEVITTAAAALARTGGTMTGDITLADPTTPGNLSVGYRGAPSTTKDANYTLVRADAGKQLLHTSSTAHSWTIPTNTVAFPVGTVILLANTGSGAVSVLRSSSVTLRIAGSSTDGTKTISQYGAASLMKVGTNDWLITGAVS